MKSKTPLIHTAVILLLSVLVYSRTLDVPFVFDDYPNIVTNPHIRKLSNIPGMFGGGLGAFASRPMMQATFALNYYFGGSDPAGYHAVNIAIHLINAVLLYLLVLTTGRLLKYGDRGTRLAALLASLIFVAHPVHTVAVTYITSRSMLLVTMFYLSGIMLFAKAVTSEKLKWPYIVGLFIVSLLGAASRENFITFPVILVLYDLFFISGFRAKEMPGHWRAYLPVALACFYLAYLMIRNTYDPRAEFIEVSVPPARFVITQLNVHWTYLRLLLLPINLNLDYDYPISRGLLEFPTLLSFLGYLSLWAGCIALARRRPVASFATLWFVITLTPVSFGVALANLRLGDVIFEHRLYLPSAAFIAALSALPVYWAGKLGAASARKFLSASVVLLLVALSVGTYMRNDVWRSGITLWADVVEKSPKNTRAHINLANFYAETGRLDEAIHYYEIALSIFSPKLPAELLATTYINLANIYLDRGLTDKAVSYYEAALRLDPRQPSVYSGLGKAYMQKDLVDKAIEYYGMSIQADPYYTLGYIALGNAYLRKGFTDKAIEYYRMTIGIDPRLAIAYNNLGVAYVDLGLSDKAIEYYETAIRIDPQYARAYGGLGNAYIQKGLVDKAIEHYRHSLRLNPEDPYAHRNLGLAYRRKGLEKVAVEHFRIADSLEMGIGGTGAARRDAEASPGLQ